MADTARALAQNHITALEGLREHLRAEAKDYRRQVKASNEASTVDEDYLGPSTRVQYIQIAELQERRADAISTALSLLAEREKMVAALNDAEALIRKMFPSGVLTDEDHVWADHVIDRMLAAAPPPPEMVEAARRAICKSRTCEGFNCCQWPSNMGRTKCPVRDGRYDDAANAAIAVLAPMIAEKCAKVADVLDGALSPELDRPVLDTERLTARTIAVAIRSKFQSATGENRRAESAPSREGEK